LLRILHLPGKMDCGGAETMLMNIYRHIDREKISFDFLVCDQDKGFYDDEIKDLGGNLFYIGSQGTLGLPKYIRELKSFLLTHKKYDVVHSHMDWQGGAIAYAAHLAGVSRRIVHVHTRSTTKSGFLFNRVLDLEKYWINKYATDFWACSYNAAAYLFKDNKQVEIVPNAIDLNKYLNPDLKVIKSIKKKINAGEETIIIGHIGNFSLTKNQKYLVEIGGILKDQKVDFRVLFTGNAQTQYGQETKELVNKYSLNDYVYFLGLMDDIYNLVHSFDVFCFPSLFEGLGIVAIEAQAAGVPCIVSEGVSNEVDMGLSLVEHVDIYNPEKWVEKIVDRKLKKINDKKKIMEAFEGRSFNIRTNVQYLERLYLSK
jgi:glycosyltransferase EpsF